MPAHLLPQRSADIGMPRARCETIAVVWMRGSNKGSGRVNQRDLTPFSFSPVFVFRGRYTKRSGIEGTNSGLKRRVGLGRLRVRGSPAVHAALLLKVTGWNILRASTTETLRALVRERLLKAGRLGGLGAIFSHFVRARSPHWSFPSLGAAFSRHWRVIPFTVA